MVFYFTSKEGTLLYMGKDKYENEDLIKYAWPEDVWFHVDNLSSAHVYVRMPYGQTWDDLSPELVRECSQLVKENSIEGVKKPSVNVIYTPASNLRKDGSMATGQVSFFDEKLVKKYVVVEKDKEMLKRLLKTREEKYPDLRDELDTRNKLDRMQQKEKFRENSKREKEERIQKEKEMEARSYDRLFKAPQGEADQLYGFGVKKPAEGGASKGKGKVGKSLESRGDDIDDVFGGSSDKSNTLIQGDDLDAFGGLSLENGSSDAKSKKASKVSSFEDDFL